jgi:hypothetical protein
MSIAETYNRYECHSELVSESQDIKWLRDPESSSG